MTAQETFDIVRAHLLKQNAKAMISDESGETHCQYRAPNGHKCAVGCLIPDELYNPTMEGTSVLGLLGTCHYLRDVPAINYHDALLIDLQGVHDGCAVRDWPARLKEVADKHGLEWGEP